MDDRVFILGVIARARQLLPGTLYFLRAETAVVPGAEIGPVPRLIVITSGNKRALLPLGDKPVELTLNQGDIFYCPPNSWEKHDWRGTYGMLCVVPRQDFLRVSYYERADDNDATRPVPRFLHTGLPYKEGMRSTLKALDAVSTLGDAGVAHSLAAALLGLAEHECRRCPAGAGGRPEQLFKRIRNWVEKSFQEDIDRVLAARVFGLSPGYVSALFGRYGEESFQDFLSRLRLEHARRLLEESSLSVAQVADMSGYRNYVHFVRRFREVNGVPPGRYRECSGCARA